MQTKQDASQRELFDIVYLLTINEKVFEAGLIDQSMKEKIKEEINNDIFASKKIVAIGNLWYNYLHN